MEGEAMTDGKEPLAQGCLHELVKAIVVVILAALFGW
jgi:hypothetical protein